MDNYKKSIKCAAFILTKQEIGYNILTSMYVLGLEEVRINEISGKNAAVYVRQIWK